MDELNDIRRESASLFEIYKKLESKRIREYQAGGDPLQVEARKADDHFLLYIALHLLVQGDVQAYRGRKMRLMERAGDSVTQ